MGLEKEYHPSMDSPSNASARNRFPRRIGFALVAAILGFTLGALMGWIGFHTLGNLLAGAIGGAIAGAIATLLLALMLVFSLTGFTPLSGSDAHGLFVLVTAVGAMLGLVTGVVEAIAPGMNSPDWWFTIGGLLNKAAVLFGPNERSHPAVAGGVGAALGATIGWFAG